MMSLSLQACLKCTECGRGPDNDTPMMLGPKEYSTSVFTVEEEELLPYCKFCFCKKSVTWRWRF